MKNKKRIILSYSHKDINLVHLLRAQLQSFKDVEFVSVEGDINTGVTLENIIRKQIDNSSLMLVLLGENWGRWQEFELNEALKKSIPVIGINTKKQPSQSSLFGKNINIPIVNWTFDELSKIITGQNPSLEYEIENKNVLKSPIIQVDFNKISEDLTRHLLEHPENLYRMDPRKFEELVAYLMERNGYEVTLTQQTRDGGFDIFAIKNDVFGKFLTIVDCKRFAKSRPVGIEIVRSLYGTLNIQKASHGIIATTSRFTNEAKILGEKYKYQMSLKEHSDILKWIQQTKI